MSAKKIKKEMRRKVKETLSNSFINLEGEISPKKLKRNIKKASKVLLAGLKVMPGEKKKEEKVQTTAE